MTETITGYRIALLPGHGRVQVPAGMTDDEVLAALTEEEAPPRRDASGR